MITLLQISGLIALLPGCVNSFRTPGSALTNRFRKSTASGCFAHPSSNQDDHSMTNEAALLKRKDFLTLVATGASSIPFQFSTSALAEDGNASGVPGPICVIGANGKTGSECVGACISRGIDVVATSRGGVYTGAYASRSPKTAVCDVTNTETIQSAIRGSRAVIFAASASKAGGTAAAVDNIGLVNVAKACIEQKIPSLVVVSSGGVSKPDSSIYKFLNIFGNIMEEKIKGEDTLRDLYKGVDASASTYTVIRPGGLTEEEGKGVGALELNQGDTKSGRIARADVAALCVEATLFPKLTGDTTFECYDADTAKPLQSVGLSNIMKQKNSNGDVFISGKEHKGATFADIFTGLEKDF